MLVTPVGRFMVETYIETKQKLFANNYFIWKEKGIYSYSNYHEKHRNK